MPLREGLGSGRWGHKFQAPEFRNRQRRIAFKVTPVSLDKGSIGSAELSGYFAVAVPRRFTEKKTVGRLDSWRQHFEHFIIVALGDFFPCGHSGGIRCGLFTLFCSWL